MPRYVLILDPPLPALMNIATDDALSAGLWLEAAYSLTFVPARTVHVLINGEERGARVDGGLRTHLAPEIAARLMSLVSAPRLATITRKAA